MSDPEIDEWEIEILQKRYKQMMDIELDKAQAEKMLLFEQERDSVNSMFFFSVWEEFDFEEVVFKDILTPDQFSKYVSQQPSKIQQTEQSLLRNDKEYLSQLNAEQARLKYYNEVLIPELSKNLITMHLSFSNDKEKIAFLQAEYHKFLINTKKEKLVEHFRHSRKFQPLHLKLTGILHEQICLYPNYFLFKSSMDNATKAVSDYLMEKLSLMYENMHEKVVCTLKNLDEFNTNNTAKHLGELRGWHVLSPVRNKIEELIFIMLFAPRKYAR